MALLWTHYNRPTSFLCWGFEKPYRVVSNNQLPSYVKGWSLCNQKDIIQKESKKDYFWKHEMWIQPHAGFECRTQKSFLGEDTNKNSIAENVKGQQELSVLLTKMTFQVSHCLNWVTTELGVWNALLLPRLILVFTGVSAANWAGSFGKWVSWVLLPRGSRHWKKLHVLTLRPWFRWILGTYISR